MNKLYQRLWLEGNLSIGYGKNISKNGDIFSLKFNPSEVEKALEIPLESLNVKTNSWFEGLFNKTQSKIVCFPYAQHFISDSPGYASNLKNKGELLSAINSIDFSNIKVFSTKSIRSMFLIGMIVSFTINTIFLMLLFLK